MYKAVAEGGGPAPPPRPELVAEDLGTLIQRVRLFPGWPTWPTWEVAGCLDGWLAGVWVTGWLGGIWGQPI